MKSILFSLFLCIATCSAAPHPMPITLGLGGWATHFYYEYKKSKRDLNKKKKDAHAQQDLKIKKITPQQIIKNMPFKKLAASGVAISAGIGALHLLQSSLSKENGAPLIIVDNTPKTSEKTKPMPLEQEHVKREKKEQLEEQQRREAEELEYNREHITNLRNGNRKACEAADQEEEEQIKQEEDRIRIKNEERIRREERETEERLAQLEREHVEKERIKAEKEAIETEAFETKFIPVEQKNLSNFQTPKDFVAYYAQFYGYKAANALYVDTCFNYNSSIKTPASYRLSNQNTWNIFTEEQKKIITQNYVAFQKELEEKKELTAQAKESLVIIRAIIDQCNDDQFAHFFGDPEMRAFQEQAKEEKYLLVVRSTGREDSQELSNAGGNDSVSAVAPESKDMIQATKQVLCSYFSEKSISQRIAAEDPQLINGTFFIPILINYMIGENSGPNQDEIPRSGVVFSTEAEGETPGVTIIQSTFGHNEAVVNGLLPVDSYYINDNFSINPLIRKKDHRLKPILNQETQKYALKYYKNDPTVSTESTLSKKEILKLARITKTLEQKYGYPVDIEFVIQNQIIHLVQARPLEKRKIDPAFINEAFLKTIELSNRFDGEMIGVGHAHAMIIEDIDQLIFDTTLKKAVDDQLLPRLTENHDANVKGIIVTTMAPATSHEATIARGQNIPVFVFPEIAAIKAAFAQGKQLLIDPQRGTIIIIEKENHADTMIEQGWFAHPIPSKVSITDLVNLPNITKDQLKKLIDEDRYQQIITLSKEKKTAELLYMIKHDPDLDTALNATCALHYNALAIIKKLDKKPILINKKMRVQLIALKGTLKSAIQDQINILIAQTQKNAVDLDDKDRLLRLYPASCIEAILKQLPKSGNIHDFSIGSLKKTEELEEELLKELTKEDINLDPSHERAELIIQYVKAASFALNPQLENTWKRFVCDLQHASAEQNTKFYAMIINLAQLDALPLWINTSVHEALRQGDFNAVYDQLIQEYNSSQDFIAYLKEISDQYATFPVDSFSTPQSFEKQWKLFEELLNETIMNQKFIKQFEASSHLSRLVSTATLKKIIDRFDTSIKALTGSTEYKKDHLHTERFKIMTYQYFAFFEHLCKIPSLKKNLGNLCGCAAQNKSKSIEEYCNDVKKDIIQKINLDLETYENSSEFQDYHFQPSFNVPGATIGSQALWSRNFKEQPSLESLFSLTHQNLLVLVSTIAKKEGLENGLPLPQHLDTFIKKIKTLDMKDQGYTMQVQYIGTSFNQNIITFSYNIPLRNHSNTFEIKYDILSKKIFFEATFIGHEPWRWERFGEVAFIISHYCKMPLSKPIDMNTKAEYISFGFELKTDEHQQIIADLMKIFSEVSCIADCHLGNLYNRVFHGVSAIKNQHKDWKEFRKTLTQFVIEKELVTINPKILFNNKCFWDFIDWTTETEEYFKHHLEQQLLEYYQSPQTNRFHENELMDKIEAIIFKQAKKNEELQKSNAQEFCKQFLTIIDGMYLEKTDFSRRGSFFKTMLQDIDNPKDFIMTLIHHQKPEVRAAGLSILTGIFTDDGEETPKFVNEFIINTLPQKIIAKVFSEENNKKLLKKTLQLYKTICKNYKDQIQFDDAIKQQADALLAQQKK